ncbi:MAG: hypothetical protein ACI8UX_002121, partial [Psychromonas sp.]
VSYVPERPLVSQRLFIMNPNTVIMQAMRDNQMALI